VRGPVIALLLALAGVQAPPRVSILNPDQGAVLTARRVAVVLKAEGVAIAPVREHRPGTAYYCVFLDRDVTPLDSAIPFGPGIVHVSTGNSWITLDEVAPGPHRLIAVLADPNHVPLHPLVADTVRFTVKLRP
jgi:Domain of unknown function (DUF4399)